MKKILIIEDDLIDQMAFVRMLEKQKLEYQYSIAKSIQEAKTELTQNSFDLVISDHNLADGTTFDLLDDLKNTPFILITGNEDQFTINILESKLGAIACFTKDLDLNYLQKLPLVIQDFFNQKINEPDQLKNETKTGTTISNISHENVSINLKNITKIFDKKTKEIKESINLFIVHKPREMEALYSYLNNKDCENVKKITHQMKSGFRLFGMKSQIELADFIEKNAGSSKTACTCEIVFDSFKQLSTDTKIAIEILKKELPLL
jgi:CheY-like chemotaxis protein